MVGGNIFNVMIIVKRISKRGHLSTVYHWVSITNPYNVDIHRHSSLNTEISSQFQLLVIHAFKCMYK